MSPIRRDRSKPAGAVGVPATAPGTVAREAMVLDDLSLKMVTAAVMVAADVRDAGSPEQRVIWDQVDEGVPVPAEYEWVRDRCRNVLMTVLAQLDGAQ